MTDPRGRASERPRIVAGTHRGRRLEVPPGRAVRPTAAKVREALFSILAARIPDARVLDVFSGSGALGIEALSRGAAHATFIEVDREASQCLRRNLERLALMDRATLVEGDARRLLRRDGPGELPGPFEAIFVDPPYCEPVDPVLMLDLARRLAPGGRLVIERDASTHAASVSSSSLAVLRSTRYGRTRLEILGAAAASGGRVEFVEPPI
jgi:16S rRNA (guanine966-N2)-methyltransferase